MDTTKFSEIVVNLLEETFEKHHGIYTYAGTSLLETLETISAAQASLPVGGSCPTLAAQVAHVTFYMEILERAMLDKEEGEADWEAIWNRVHAVTPKEWEASKAALKQTYRRILVTVQSFDSWEPVSRLYILAIITHTAYHLGVIRQSLCILPTAT